MEAESSTTAYNAGHIIDRKGKGRALPGQVDPPSRTGLSATEAADDGSWKAAWRRSRRRAQADKTSWDYTLSSGVAGGIAGCVAKSAIAPLDRVKILFQTSNAEFAKYAGTPMGLVSATGQIYRSGGFRGLFQGHSATLLRIFPYAGIKFMAYDRLEGILIPTPDHRTPLRFFLAGSISGITSVLFTYPLELLRVRLAYQTSSSERTSLREAIRTIYHEADKPLTAAKGNSASSSSSSSSISRFTRAIPFYPFYRGFSITILGMIPYAGVSFLTYGTLKRYAPAMFPDFAKRKTSMDLACGAIAGAVSQTASYPFEVVRRRMQVGGAKGGAGITWRESVRGIMEQRGWRGFFVGLSIGYVKVIPMTSISFATWQFMRRALEI